MKVCIVGLGAIGGLIAARLARAGIIPNAVARGETLRSVRRDGLVLIESAEGVATRTAWQIQASDDPAALGPQDLIILAVKTTALGEVAGAIAPLLGEQTAVLCAMNGIPWWFFHRLNADSSEQPLRSVDPTGAITQSIPPRRVVGCVTHLAAATISPGVVQAVAGNRLIVGEPGGPRTSARAAAMVDLLRKADFEVEESDNIQRDIWFKLWGNLTVNPISAITGATVDRILDDDLVRDYMTRCMAEAASIGNRIGLRIDIEPQARHEVTRKLGAFRTSMLQDLDAGKPLELDAIIGAVVEMARRVGEPTPNIDALFGMARLHARVRNLY